MKLSADKFPLYCQRKSNWTCVKLDVFIKVNELLKSGPFLTSTSTSLTYCYAMSLYSSTVLILWHTVYRVSRHLVGSFSFHGLCTSMFILLWNPLCFPWSLCIECSLFLYDTPLCYSLASVNWAFLYRFCILHVVLYNVQNWCISNTWRVLMSYVCPLNWWILGCCTG